MKKIGLSILIVATSIATSFSQKTKYEWGFMLGRSNYLGDIQTNNTSLAQGNLAVGVKFKKPLSKNLTFATGIAITRIHASDSVANNEQQLNRNLHFRSNISELHFMFEYTLLELGMSNNNDASKKKFRLSPYLFAGIGLYHFNPQAMYQSNWVDLQPLNTEGQGTNAIYNANAPYSLNQVNIPFGVGLKYALNKKITLAWELGWRKTFTDYLDDVSTVYPDLQELATINGQAAKILSFRGSTVKGFNGVFPGKGARRGNPDNLDWYFINGISLNYKIKY